MIQKFSASARFDDLWASVALITIITLVLYNLVQVAETAVLARMGMSQSAGVTERGPGRSGQGAGQLAPVADAELGVDPAEVVLDRLRRHEELLGDLAVAAARDGQARRRGARSPSATPRPSATLRRGRSPSAASASATRVLHGGGAAGRSPARRRAVQRLPGVARAGRATRSVSPRSTSALARARAASARSPVRRPPPPAGRHASRRPCRSAPRRGSAAPRSVAAPHRRASASCRRPAPAPPSSVSPIRDARDRRGQAPRRAGRGRRRGVEARACSVSRCAERAGASSAASATRARTSSSQTVGTTLTRPRHGVELRQQPRRARRGRRARARRSRRSCVAVARIEITSRPVGLVADRRDGSTPRRSRWPSRRRCARRAACWR